MAAQFFEMMCEAVSKAASRRHCKTPSQLCREKEGKRRPYFSSPATARYEAGSNPDTYGNDGCPVLACTWIASSFLLAMTRTTVTSETPPQLSRGKEGKRRKKQPYFSSLRAERSNPGTGDDLDCFLRRNDGVEGTLPAGGWRAGLGIISSIHLKSTGKMVCTLERKAKSTGKMVCTLERKAKSIGKMICTLVRKAKPTGKMI
jgi:hypothetical protein